ncbi:MAG: hypothetical protein ACI9TH_001773 [Kiritimatiellia bacterium]
MIQLVVNLAGHSIPNGRVESFQYSIPWDRPHRVFDPVLWFLVSWLAVFHIGMYIFVPLIFPMQDPPQTRSAWWWLLVRELWPKALLMMIAIGNLFFVNPTNTKVKFTVRKTEDV